MTTFDFQHLESISFRDSEKDFLKCVVNVSLISSYFIWSTTRQGYKYWQDKARYELLKQEDRLYIAALFFARVCQCRSVTFSREADYFIRTYGGHQC